MEVGDVGVEIVHFNPDWSDADQHDAFVPSNAPATQPAAESGKVISGVFTSSSGPFNLSERFEPATAGSTSRRR